MTTNIIITSLDAYEVSVFPVRVVHDYLSCRKQRTSVKVSYSELLVIAFGVRQGVMLGPMTNRFIIYNTRR